MIRTLIALSLIGLLFVQPAFAACTMPGSSTSTARQAAMSRGFNLSGWLERADAPQPSIQTLQSLRVAGFTHVRLPVNGSLLMLRFSDLATQQALLRRLDLSVQTLLGLGFSVSIDFHPDARFAQLHRAQPEVAFQELAMAWTLLVLRYVLTPHDRVFFELLNEPTVDDVLWRSQAARLVMQLRPLALGRTLVVGSGNAQRIDTLVNWMPLPDPDVVYAVHFYDPLIFTHQGQDWDPASPLRWLHDVPFPVDLGHPDMVSLLAELEAGGHGAYAAILRQELASPWGENKITDQFTRLAAWAAQNRRFVVVNEFGVLKYVAPPADRARWIGAVRRTAETRCIGWTHWDYAEGFGFLNANGQVDGAILDALLGP